MDHRRRPRAIAFAAVFFTLVGALLTLLGTLTMVAFAGADCAMAPRCLDLRGIALIGAVITGVGIVHLAAGRGTWRGRTWGRLVGGIVAAIGTAVTSLLTIGILLIQSDLAMSALLPYGPLLLAYGASLVGVWRWYPRAGTDIVGPS